MITISKRLSYRKIDELKFVLRSKIFSFHVAVFLLLYLLQKVTGHRYSEALLFVIRQLHHISH